MQNPIKKSKIEIFERVFAIVFIGLGGVIIANYIALDFLRVEGVSTSPIKFSLVGLCLFFVLCILLLHIKEKGKRTVEDALLLGAFAFTLTADVFLILLNRDYPVGVGIFIVAQVFHFLRMGFANRKRWKYLLISLWIRLGLCLLSIPILPLMMEIDLLTRISVCYAINLLMNFVDSLIYLIYQRSEKWIIVLIGFILFMGCDICVMLSNTGTNVREIIWIFYGPSQILLALSILFNKERKPIEKKEADE